MYLVSCGKTAYMHLAAAARVIDCSHLISMSLLHQFQGPANAHGADEARVVMRKKQLERKTTQVPRAKRQAQLTVAVIVVQYSHPTHALL
jgi:hypothetical protein